MTLVLALLALAAPLAASAQTTPPDVWPLVPGNTWTYIRDSRSWTNSGSGTRNPSRVESWTVLDSVTTGAGRLPRVRFAGGECLVQTTQAGDVASFRLLDVSGAAACTQRAVPTFNGGDFSVRVDSSIPTTFPVGGESVTVPRVRAGRDESGDYSFVLRRMADGLGMTRTSGYYHLGASGSYSDESAVLRHAVIGGRAVGQTLATRPEFWPLTVGNRWEFRVTGNANESVGAVAWTVEAAGSGVALRMQRVQNGAVVSSATCQVSLVEASPETVWQTRFSLSGCDLSDLALAPNLIGEPVALGIDVYAPARSLTIGSQAVVADSASGFNGLGGAPAGYAAETSYVLARGIGPVSFYTYRLSPYTLRKAELAYARIGTTTYGQQVVADDDGPATTAALMLTAGPNPARGALALAFALPAPGDAAVEVVDALGRSVLRADLGAQPAGAGTARLDVSGLAPGVYVVRLVSGDVRASTRISVLR